MKILRILFLLLCLGWLQAYNFGGNLNDPNPPVPVAGDVYIYIGSAPASYVTPSNVVNVSTVRIDLITTNETIVTPGKTMLVTMSVTNTGLSTVTINSAQIKIYRRAFPDLGLLETPDNYEVTGNVYQNTSFTPPGGVAISAGTAHDFVFSITATDNNDLFLANKANVLILDGYLRFSDTYYDHSWTNNDLLDQQYQYASLVTANWFPFGLPLVHSVSVSPNPAKSGPVIITINFTELMDAAQPADVRVAFTGITINPTVIQYLTGTDFWVGQVDIPEGQSDLYDGTAVIRMLAATNNIGQTIIPSYSAGTISVDTLKPTLSLTTLYPSANCGLPYPITAIALNDSLSATPTVRLTLTGNVQVLAVFTGNENGTTWNGTVIIPYNLDFIDTIATFDIPVDSPYRDDAGNTNNVLLGTTTVSIADSVPFITRVDFDTVQYFEGMSISPEPYLTVTMATYRTMPGNPGAPVPMEPSSFRVTIDNVLAISGVSSIPQSGTDLGSYLFSCSFDVPSELTRGDHVFQFQVQDIDAHVSPIYIATVNVFSRDFELLRDPVPFPNPFSPNDDGLNDSTEIVYVLSRSSDVYVYIYDLNGDLVWKRFIAKGQEGSHAGINRLRWDGQPSFSSSNVLPNGVYICHILIDSKGERKTLGRTKIVIMK